MELLVFAHRGEAQTFIKELKAKALNESLYQFKDGLIYICNEGIYDVLSSLGYIINFYQVTQVINYGIAGTLNSDLSLNSICEIRTVYLEQEHAIEFKSFTLNNLAEYDCITSFSRVLDNAHAQKLKPIADIVDRELWSIAKVCKLYNKNLNAFKLISDLAGDKTDCFDLKSRALELSQKLYQHYIKREIIISDISAPKELPFNASQYQINQFNKLIKLIDQQTYTTILAKLDHIEASDKEKTNILLDEIKKILYPFKYKIINQIEKQLLPLKEAGFNTKYDQNLEKEKLALSLEVNSQKNITDAQNALSEFNYDEFLKIFQGEIDV
jgi:hypothetical protein